MTFRSVALWLFLSIIFVGVLVLGAIVLGLALLAVPVLLLAGTLVGGKRGPARPRPGEDPAVYEGEFRVLDEKPLDERR
jgi:hypothetical protein